MNHKYFIDIAKAVASKSKDPSSKVGCVIVDEDNRIVSTGYNGFVAGCDEDHMSWERPEKYFLVIHAEENALIYSRRDLSNCRVYITHGPCEVCLKHLLQAKVRDIYYDDPSIIKDRGTDGQKAAIRSLLRSTDAEVINVNNGKHYYTEIL